VGTTIPLPLGSYVLQSPRASCKRLVGCFSEYADRDSSADAKAGASLQGAVAVPVYLRRMSGINPIAGFGDGSGSPVRGYWEMQGVLYCVIGQNFYSVAFNPSTQVASLTLINPGTPITGTGFVRMADNGACLVIIQPNTSNAWTYCPFGGGFQPLSNPTFTFYGARDVWFVDSYIVFLANTLPSGGGYGTQIFFNDDGRIVSGNNQITFTTGGVFIREFGTDPFIGGAVDHREILLFGSRTSEGFMNAGNQAGTPFSSAPDTFIELGCHPLAQFAIAKQDQSVFWVANDRTVRRRQGQTPVRVSNSGIEAILTNADLTGCYALTPTVTGHPLWILTMPNVTSPDGYSGRTIAYDCLTQKWFELQSAGIGSWRALTYFNGLNGQQLIGDSLSDATGALNTGVFTEFGTTQKCELTTQSVYDAHNRIAHRRVEVVATVGGAVIGQTPPKMDMFMSDDNGHNFESCEDPQDLGSVHQFEARTVWWNLGQSRDRVYKFRVTDPTPLFTVDIQATLEGGKY
jgi:hypothetical protein